MAEQVAKILFQHPNDNIRKNAAPRILETVLPGSTTPVSYLPEIDEKTGRVTYDIPLSYASSLIGAQPDRYFLLEPAFIIVRRRTGPGAIATVKVARLTQGELAEKARQLADEREEEVKADKKAEKAADKKAEEKKLVEL